jgi:capsular exopolysaccharide synthesis family protein
MARTGLLDATRPEVPALGSLRVATDLDPARREDTPLAFLSSVSGEGATTIASSYAISAAAAGRRVLLVDVDLHTAALSQRFGWPRSPGLSDLLVGEVDAGAVIRTFDTRGVDLDVVSAGSPMTGATDALRSQAFADILDSWARTYDLVVIDAPPVLEFADARALSTLRIDTVVVVRQHQRRTRLSSTLTELKRAGANVIGLVVNEG